MIIVSLEQGPNIYKYIFMYAMYLAHVMTVLPETTGLKEHYHLHFSNRAVHLFYLHEDEPHFSIDGRMEINNYSTVR